MLTQHELNVTVVLPVYYVIVKGRYKAVDPIAGRWIIKHNIFS